MKFELLMLNLVTFHVWKICWLKILNEHVVCNVVWIWYRMIETVDQNVECIFFHKNTQVAQNFYHEIMTNCGQCIRYRWLNKFDVKLMKDLLDETFGWKCWVIVTILIAIEWLIWHWLQLIIPITLTAFNGSNDTNDKDSLWFIK